MVCLEIPKSSSFAAPEVMLQCLGPPGCSSAPRRYNIVVMLHCWTLSCPPWQELAVLKEGFWPGANRVARPSCDHSLMLHRMFACQGKPAVEVAAQLQATGCDKSPGSQERTAAKSADICFDLDLCSLCACFTSWRQVTLRLKDTPIMVVPV